MNILLCNERFIFRYGVDRVLIMLGKGLKQRGHSVHVMTMKCNRPVIDSFAEKITIINPDCSDYAELNESTARWLEKEWDRLFHEGKPDAVLIAGWPFYESIRVFKSRGCLTVFNDHGAVPLDGYTEGALAIQNKLRALRRQYLPQVHEVIGVSDFIVNSQSIPDTGQGIPIHTILNGVDHIDIDMWDTKVAEQKESETILSLVHQMKQKGKRIIVNLGRWEADCYKNSEAAFTIIRQIRKSVPESCMLVLGNPEDLSVPEDLREAVIPVGFCDDDALRRLMESADMGVSVSKWEGFNLPLGEMQWLGKPVLVFNIGAHPEVIVHPWYLCEDDREMAQKGIMILKGQGGRDAATRKMALTAFRNRFTWNRAVNQYQQHFVTAVQGHRGGLRIIIDVTNATRDPANSGVIRVTRMICRTMQEYLDPMFVVWDDDTSQYIFPTEDGYQQLGEFNGPKKTASSVVSPNDNKIPLAAMLGNTQPIPTWILLTETVMERRGHLIRRFAKEHGISTAAIFYDAIPIIHPELCKDPIIRENHGDYMRGLADVDAVFPISQFSSDCLRSFWDENRLVGGGIHPVLIAGNFSGDRPVNVDPEEKPVKVMILCVSTLEPRKNHRGLIEACLAVQRDHPDLDWSLTLVGNRYAGAPEIPDYVEQVQKENPRVRWTGIADDATLDALYRDSTFTVYPSIIEGFGLPIIESIFYGKPCVTYEQGVMAELAGEGGCITTDVLDLKRFAEDLHSMITDVTLRRTLAEQARKRPVKTWNDYCGQLLDHLLRLRPTTEMQPLPAESPKPGIQDAPFWTDVIYPRCLIDNWQMSESERLAMTAILTRHRPQCSIELGTYRGGSLSLIAQYSTVVFSIDIDPSIPGKYSYISNASFLTGPSVTILPRLIRELNEQNIPIDFILIDADHSSRGIQCDLDIVLTYKPKTRLFVLMHDSFNPGCRSGMLAARWQESPYVAWVDLDFIPGRLIQHGGGGDGELWGGLAMAYLTPSLRRGPLQIHQSASRMQKIVNEAVTSG
jgi:glycosyltransferase involved in cell wall biosynthesis